MKAAVKTINLRLAEPVYEALRNLAEGRGISMNKVIEEEIISASEAERRTRVKAAFAKIAAMSPEDQSVDFAFEAQKEVVLGGN